MIKISEVIKHIEKLYKIELTEIQVDFLKHVHRLYVGYNTKIGFCCYVMVSYDR